MRYLQKEKEEEEREREREIKDLQYQIIIFKK